MRDNKNILSSRQINSRLLYDIVVLTSSCSLLLLSLLLPANIALAQQENDSPMTTTTPSNTNFNFATAGDWDCTDDTTETVNNIEDKNPELVIGLGDNTYHGNSLDCWLDIIDPIDSIMKIAIGNHDISELEELMDHYGLTEQYYSFDYQNVHFIALGTEAEYLDLSNDIAKEQLAFVKSDLEKASNNPNIDWIIPFFHRIMYPESQSGGIIEEYDHNLVDVYHPLFEKYGVNLVLQGHVHAYERTYPLRFNSEDSENPIVTNEDSGNYRSVDGMVVATVGTGGAFATRLYLSPEWTPVQETGLFGFLNVDVSSDGTTLVGTFYDNADGEIKDKFTITKSGVPTAAEENADNTQIVPEDEMQSEPQNGDLEDDEVSAGNSDGENGNADSSIGNQDNDNFDLEFDNIDDDVL
jgi:hypothetical protein